MPTSPDQLLKHVQDCERLHEDFRGLIDDYADAVDGVTTRYALDQSEIHSHVMAETNDEQLRVFSDDSVDLTRTVQDYVLNKLLFSLDDKVILLPPYGLELRSFAEYLRNNVVAGSVADYPEAWAEARKVEEMDEFVELEDLAYRVEHGAHGATNEQLAEAIQFFERHAGSMLRLLDATQKAPLERLAHILEQQRLEAIGALIDADLRADESLADEWEARLIAEGRPRTASNRLDALAVATVVAANQYWRERNIKMQIRLVTRTKAMLRVDRALTAAERTSGRRSGVLRHPRAFVALRRIEDGPIAATLQRLNVMQGTLDLVRSSYAEAAPLGRAGVVNGAQAGAASASRTEQVEGLIRKVKKELEEGINLASTSAVSQGDLTANVPSPDIRARFLRLFALVRRDDLLFEEINKHVRDLAHNVDTTQQLLGAVLKDQPFPAAKRPLAFGTDEATTVVKSDLWWMAYTLEFKDPRVRAWSETYASQPDTSLSGMITQFQSGFSSGLDYEMLLFLAWQLGAWDRWSLATRYCEIALTEQRANKRAIPTNEGKFFLAVCLRMHGRPTAERYSEALLLLDEAAREKELAYPATPVDPRYVKEKALLHFYWGRVERRKQTRESMAQERAHVEEALRLSGEALDLAAHDPDTRAQIYNNLCFFYTDDENMERPEKVRETLAALEFELRGNQIDEWPINFVDTVLVAHTRLRQGATGPTSINVTYWLKLIRRLKRGLAAGQLRPHDRAEVALHIREAEAALPEGV